MPEVIWGPRPQRYEVQWLGDSGSWWTSRYFKHRAMAVLFAAFALGTYRVLDHAGGES